MGELSSVIISGVVWDAIKKGVSITTGYLKGKLSNWLLDDQTIEKIKECVCDIPDAYLISEEMIKAYINSNEEILSVLETAKGPNVSISQNIEHNEGIVIGNNQGTVKIKQYTNSEKPRNTLENKLSLTKTRSKFNPVQVVKSFSFIRENCVLEDGMNVYADVVIPKEVKEKEGCQFLMILFSYIPSENWINFFDENYKMKFYLETSENIKQVQLQIKDSHQQQFVDVGVHDGEFYYSLAEIAPKQSWKDIREICFTIFADDSYIVGEKGYIRIKDFELERVGN